MGGLPAADGTTSLPAPLDGELALSPLTGDSGWRVAGEITLATCRDWEQMLDGLVRSDAPVCHPELSAVTFADVAGVSALAVTAHGLTTGRRVVVKRPPACMRRLEMFWPKLHAIEVVSC
ncbi:STAS domain-containing protein [Streptomyces sp. NPDC056468]|uniref:STAS domain-containing protein n=1 Tax=Streptomyces sp. NPDC056468 TaxID=3345830 RepID=UPI00368D7D96